MSRNCQRKVSIKENKTYYVKIISLYFIFTEVDAEDPCSECSDDATCEKGKCVCKEGFGGDGKTCTGKANA